MFMNCSTETIEINRFQSLALFHKFNFFVDRKRIQGGESEQFNVEFKRNTI